MTATWSRVSATYSTYLDIIWIGTGDPRNRLNWTNNIKTVAFFYLRRFHISCWNALLTTPTFHSLDIRVGYSCWRDTEPQSWCSTDINLSVSVFGWRVMNALDFLSHHLESCLLSPAVERRSCHEKRISFQDYTYPTHVSHHDVTPRQNLKFCLWRGSKERETMAGRGTRKGQRHETG